METIELTEAAYLDAVTFEASKWDVLSRASELSLMLAFAFYGEG